LLESTCSKVLESQEIICRAGLCSDLSLYLKERVHLLLGGMPASNGAMTLVEVQEQSLLPYGMGRLLDRGYSAPRYAQLGYVDAVLGES
jgi:hypothetical protein